MLLPNFVLLHRWWLSLGFAIVEAIIVAFYSLPYSIYAASYRYANYTCSAYIVALAIDGYDYL